VSAPSLRPHGVASATAPRAPDGRLPAGLVTFLLTDIEGSTRLFREREADYPGLLAAHRDLVSGAVIGAGGVLVEAEGDAVLAAFAAAGAGLAAALEAQRALTAHPWPPGAEVRVRIGLHTGDATPVGDRYVALALHQVARICAGAHGGQVLVSQATADAAAGALPDGASLVPVGSFRLRGFPTPVRLLQLTAAGLPQAFPPPRALGVAAHNLPVPRAGFVGRDADRRAVAGLLAATGVVTVVGLGGVGKTRLALQVALDVVDDLGDGAWLVELAPVREAAGLVRAVAEVLEVREQPGRDAADVLVEALAERSLLLVLDSCEHLLDDVAPLVERIAQHCPRVQLLATSREPLDVEGEAVWRLDPLPPAEASRLFADRAAQSGVRVDEANGGDVAAVVAHLAGIPLAVELAAAALRDRSLPALRRGLSGRLALTASGRRTAGRHQTLRAALEWSLELLGDDERRLFARLAVFAGGGTLAAAEAVCSAPPLTRDEVEPLLRRLVRASLVVPGAASDVGPDAGGDRWSLLEPVRELALLQLEERGEVADTVGRHRDWVTDWVEELSPRLGRHGQAHLMAGLAADADNLRRALDTAVADAEVTTALRLAVAASPYWTSHGDWTEGCERLRAVLALPGGDPLLRGRALAAVGGLLLLHGETAEASEQLDAALPLLAGDDAWSARLLSGQGYVAFRHGSAPQAEALWERALELAERAGDEREQAQVLRSLAIVAGTHGDQPAAAALLERGTRAAERAGDDQLLRLILGSTGESRIWTGQYAAAEQAYARALELAGAIGDLSARPLLLAELGWVALLRGDVPVAARLGADAVELAEDLGNRRVLGHALRLRAEAALRSGSFEDAEALLARALPVVEALGAPAELMGVLCSQAVLAMERLRLVEARELAARAESLTTLGHTLRLVSPAWVIGCAALHAGELVDAEQAFARDLAAARASRLGRHLANSTWGLAAVRAAAQDRDVGLRLHAEGLRRRHRLGDVLGVADSLVGLVTVLPAGSAEAAPLLAAARAVRSRLGAVPTPRQDAELAAASVGVASVGVASVGEEDDALDVDAAVALALSAAGVVTDGPGEETGDGLDGG